MLPEPIASGAFDKTPFVHVLIYLDQKQLSGTLAIWPEVSGEGESEGQDRILFLKGRPVAGRLVDPAANLREGLLRLFTRTQAPYAFYEKNLLGDDRVSGRVDPLALIAESLRLVAREEVVGGVLDRLGDTKLRLQPKVDLKRFAFDRQEQGVVELLQAEPTDLASLVAGGGLSAVRARRLVYLLVISKAVAPYDPEEAARARPTRPSGEHVVGSDEAANASESLAAAPAAASSSGGEVADSAPPVEAAAAPAAQPANASAQGGADRSSQPSLPPAGAVNVGKLHGRLDRLAAVPTMPASLTPELRER